MEFTWYLKQHKRSICTCLQCLLPYDILQLSTITGLIVWEIYNFWISYQNTFCLTRNILDVHQISNMKWNYKYLTSVWNLNISLFTWFDKYDDLWCHEHKNVIQQHVFCFVVLTFYREIKAFYSKLYMRQQYSPLDKSTRKWWGFLLGYFRIIRFTGGQGS